MFFEKFKQTTHPNVQQTLFVDKTANLYEIVKHLNAVIYDFILLYSHEWRLKTTVQTGRMLRIFI